MRRLGISTAMALLVWLALPVVAGAENDPRWNGTYDRLVNKPHDAEKCGCRTRFGDESQSSGGLHWVYRSGVDLRSQRINRFRSRHSGVLWQARAFPGSVRRVHGFHGRRGYRGHGRRW
jgi:hypothetical protein